MLFFPIEKKKDGNIDEREKERNENVYYAGEKGFNKWAEYQIGNVNKLDSVYWEIAFSGCLDRWICPKCGDNNLICKKEDISILRTILFEELPTEYYNCNYCGFSHKRKPKMGTCMGY